MELKAWSGDNGLPSNDCCCLQFMAYGKICGSPVKFLECNNPWASPTGSLPLFQHGPQVKITSFRDYVNHLKKQNFSADEMLSGNQKADVRAYEALVKDKLAPALMFVKWCDLRNYIEYTRPWYAKKLPFPLNYFIPGKMHRLALEELQSSFDYAEPSQIENQVYKSAQECLNLLSQRLGDQEFFFGKSPCSLDAIVFGYLAPLVKLEFPNAALPNYVKACSNLNQFVSRILQRYFPAQKSKEQVIADAGKRKEPTASKTETSDFPHKYRDLFLSSLFALSAMLFYAFSKGILQIQIEDDFGKDFSNGRSLEEKDKEREKMES